MKLFFSPIKPGQSLSFCPLRLWIANHYFPSPVHSRLGIYRRLQRQECEVLFGGHIVSNCGRMFLIGHPNSKSRSLAQHVASDIAAFTGMKQRQPSSLEPSPHVSLAEQ